MASQYADTGSAVDLRQCRPLSDDAAHPLTLNSGAPQNPDWDNRVDPVGSYETECRLAGGGGGGQEATVVSVSTSTDKNES